MKYSYDPEVDVINIVLKRGPVDESDESHPGIILDYDKQGDIVGIEILNASKRTKNPRSIEVSLAG